MSSQIRATSSPCDKTVYNSSKLEGSETPLVTILMPCLNEAETLPFCIEEAKFGLRDAGVTGEILIADNGSTDGSAEIAASLGARVVTVAERGYGSALRGGMEAARGRYIIMGDADASYDFSCIRPFIEKLEAGADLVMGCRLPAGGGRILPGAMPWKHRWIGNPILTFIGRLLFRCPSHDFHCGLRALTKSAFERMDLRTTGMEFASEMVIKASLRGMRIEEVPITLRKDRRSRPPHLRSWRDGWRHLRFMLLFSPRWLFFYPGIFLTLASGFLFLGLLRGEIQLAGVSLDINTLDVASLGLLFGYQMILLGTFVRIFAYTRGFLPEHHILRKAFRFFTLEKGLLAGFAALVAGFLLIGFVILGWAREGFGDLDPHIQTRWVIAGRTLSTLGAQTILFSLVFSYLGMDD
ncbi:MAG: glycosyltransferase family 2 protein [Chthoniobacterales bacterium]|nr:glycosyltransferase family 2 protein [Chthoniobacterales bacterium]